MNLLNTLLRKIINRQYDFCCLCLKTIATSPIYLEDDVILVESNIGSNVKLSDILAQLLGNHVFQNISLFEAVCQRCFTLTINSYKFIMEAKDMVQYLYNAIDQLTVCCEDNGTVNDEDCKTLFVSLSPDLHTSKLIYDNTLLGNAVEGLERFNKIKEGETKGATKVQKKLTSDQKINRKKLKFRDTYKSLVSVVDILYNKNDPTDLKCKVCLNSFSTPSNLRNHYIRVHSPKTYKCHKCGRRFGSKAILLAHKQGSHVNLVCTDCGKTFHNKHTLRIHEKSHYLKLVCQDCGRVYKNRNTFKKHLDNDICQSKTRRSQVDAKYTCDYCNKKYTQKITLRVHIQYEHLNYKYLECKWCSKKFWCQSRLNAHSVKHTKERNFVCSICNGKFVTRESLLYHTRIHTGEKPYQCPHCESRFLSASRRSAHVKSHHMDPTVECNICHSKFRSHHYLHKHKKIHTKAQDIKIKNEVPNSEELVVPKTSKRITYPNLLKTKQPKPILEDVDFVKQETGTNVLPKKESILNDLASNCIKYYIQIDPNAKGIQDTLQSNMTQSHVLEVCSVPYSVYETNPVQNDKIYLEMSDGEDNKFIIQG